MIRFKLLAAALFAWAVSPLIAQPAPSLTVELRLLAFSTNLEVSEVYAQDPTAAPSAASIKMDIKTYLNHEFSTIQLTGKKIVFTSKPDRASLTREGETLAEMTLPDGVTSAILIVVPNKPGEKAKYRMLTINDAKKSFPPGSYHAANMSPFPIRLMLEQKVYEFKPGHEMIIDHPPSGENSQAAMQTFAFRNNAWVKVTSGSWSNPIETRGVLILFQDPVTGNVQLRAFDDVPPREPKQDKAAP